jgi:hypothetical protein
MSLDERKKIANLFYTTDLKSPTRHYAYNITILSLPRARKYPTH